MAKIQGQISSIYAYVIYFYTLICFIEAGSTNTASLLVLQSSKKTPCNHSTFNYLIRQLLKPVKFLHLTIP